MKKIILFLMVFTFLMPSISYAQTDQRCFTREQCTKARAEFRSADADQGFYPKPKECGKVPAGSVDGTVGEDMGFCLPATQTVTQIRFGGKQTFENIGDFIKYIYKYGVIAAGILSTVVIMIAGIQWVVSGGNASTIGEAKKRIFGAVIGLVIAVGSFTILQTINPALVELRLPQVWLINKFEIVPQFCDASASPVALAISAEAKEKIINQYPTGEQSSQRNIEVNKIKQENLKNIQYNISPEKTLCGAEYFVQNAGSQTCVGTFCSTTDVTETCVPYSISGDRPSEGDNKRANVSECWRGQLVVNLKMASLEEELYSVAGQLAVGPVGGILDYFADIFETPTWLKNDEFVLYAACYNGTRITEPKEVEPGDGYKFQIWESKGGGTFSAYTIQLIVENVGKIKNACDSDESLSGFYISTQANLKGDNWSKALTSAAGAIAYLVFSEDNRLYFSLEKSTNNIIVSQDFESKSFLYDNYFPVEWIEGAKGSFSLPIPTNQQDIEKSGNYIEKNITQNDIGREDF